MRLKQKVWLAGVIRWVLRVSRGSSRESSLGHLDPWTVKVLLQTGIELGQTAVLEVSDTLLLVLDITPRAKFVSGHCDGR